MGDSGIPAPAPNESRFVADETFGELDVPHPVTASGDVVTVSISTTRVVGLTDNEGFLVTAQKHLAQGTLADTLLLSIRAKISALDFGGQLDRDGLDVEAFLHKDTGRERSLGHLQVRFGSGWQEYHVDVKVGDVRFPADPCPAWARRPPAPRTRRRPRTWPTSPWTSRVPRGAAQQPGHDPGGAGQRLGGQLDLDGPDLPGVRAGVDAGPVDLRVGHLPGRHRGTRPGGADEPLGMPPSLALAPGRAGLEPEPGSQHGADVRQPGQ